MKNNLSVNSSLHYFINSTLVATPFFEISKFELKQFDFFVMRICIVIHKDRFDASHFTAKELSLQDFLADIVFAFLMCTCDIVQMQVCTFQKYRDGQARSEVRHVIYFEFLIVIYTENSAMQVVNFLSIHHTLCWRRRLLTAMQCFTILYTSCGRKRLTALNFTPCCTHCLGAGS